MKRSHNNLIDLFNRMELDDLLHRTEDLFPSDAHVVGDIGENSRLDEESHPVFLISTCHQAGAFLFAACNQFKNLLVLFGVNLNNTTPAD
jgi:hypothetical protein